jgi:hypothetical protein
LTYVGSWISSILRKAGFRTSEVYFFVFLLILSPYLLPVLDQSADLFWSRGLTTANHMLSLWRILWESTSFYYFQAKQHLLSRVTETVHRVKADFFTFPHLLGSGVLGLILAVLFDADTRKTDEALLRWRRLLLSTSSSGWRRAMQSLHAVYAAAVVATFTLIPRWHFLFSPIRYSLLAGLAYVAAVLTRSALTTSQRVVVAAMPWVGSVLAVAVLVRVGWAAWAWVRQGQVKGQAAVVRLTLYAKELLLSASGPVPVEYIFEQLRDAILLANSLPFADLKARGLCALRTSETDLCPDLSPGVWKQVKARVEMDARVDCVDVFVDGNHRRSWRIRGPAPTPVRPPPAGSVGQ